MTRNFCPNCGNSTSQTAKFCQNCGHNLEVTQGAKVKTSAEPQVQQPAPQQPQYYQPQSDPSTTTAQTGAYYPPPQSQQGMRNWGKPPDYVRPPNYVFTQTISERLVGTFKRDVHVVEEIEERQDLQEEAFKLLIVSLSIISLFNIISVLSFDDVYNVESTEGSIAKIVLSRFVGGFIYIYLIARAGKWVGGRETDIDVDQIIRVMSYAYAWLAIEEVISFVSYATGNPLIGVFGALFYVYLMFVFLFVIRRALDRGYIIAIIAIILAFIGAFLFEVVVAELVRVLFDGSYELVDPPF